MKNYAINEILQKFDKGVNGSERLILGVWDCVSGVFLGIHLEENISNAVRGFRASMIHKQNDFNFNKNDFELKLLGYVDISNGKILPLDAYVLVRGVDCE